MALRGLLIGSGVVCLLGAGIASAAALTVTLGATGPQPKSATVGWGDTVTFVNGDTNAHVITAERHPELASPSIPPQGSYTYVFNGKAGLYPYRQLGPTPKDSAAGAIVLEVRGTVTLQASRTSVKFGDAIVLRGKSTLPTSPVDLQRDEAGSGHSFSEYQRRQLQPDGSYSFTVRPRIGVRYRATAALEQLKSPEIEVKVAPRLTIGVSRRSVPSGRPVTIVARVAPVASVSSLDLKRFDTKKHKWVEVASKAVHGPKVIFTWVARPGTTRLRTFAGRRELREGFDQATSPQVSVTGVGPLPGTAPADQPKKKKNKRHHG